MNLTNAQNKYINNKHLGKQLIRGKKETGKSTSAIYRLVNLKNNYCLRDEDKLIYISYNDDKLNQFKSIYESIDLNNEYLSLFSFIDNKVEFKCMNNLIDSYYSIIRGNDFYEFIDNDKSINIIKDITDSIGLDKKLRKRYSEQFILDEIMWIKASGFTFEEYLNIERKGRKKRLNKEGEIRNILYRIYNEYNIFLDENNFIDKYHKLFSILQNKDKITNKYAHIILDDCRKYTLGEIKFIRSILNTDICSMTYLLDDEPSNRENVWMIKGRKIKDIDNEKCRNFVFKEVFKKEVKSNLIEYDYIDLRGRASFRFYKDSFSHSSNLMVEGNNCFENVDEDQVELIPMFNEIAAGEPILINPSVEDMFYMPNYFPRNRGDKFLLKVKGDSMKDININDGDMVLIKRQSTANNNDIVAINIDGSATLKTLKITKDNVYLKPENAKYDIINLEDKEAIILGIALGVIKENN